jgi:uncharacterized coiled-coil protein SlyX
MTSTPEIITSLSERIFVLELQMFSQTLAIAGLKASVANHDIQLQHLDCSIYALESNLNEWRSRSAAPV